jgi:hypothetical protein
MCAMTHIAPLVSAEKRGKVDHNSVLWLENALNPFPDYAERPEGMPCHDVVYTATKNVQKIMTISAPPDPPPGATTWSCTIWLMPYDEVSLSPLNTTRLATFQGLAVRGPVLPPVVESRPGIIMIVTAWDGLTPEPANPFSTSFVPGEAVFNGLTLSDAWCTEGSARIIGCGYEITDNTPQLYRGGNMVNWRKSSGTVDLPMSVYDPTNASVIVDYSTRIFTGLPTSQAEAFRIPGSTSTRFTEGAYVVGTFNRRKETFELPIGYSSCVVAGKIDATSPDAHSPIILAGAFPLTAARFGEPYLNYTPFTFTHLDHSGSYCTGLSPQTNFTVALKATLEILPNASSVLIDFTTPTVGYDPRIEELYEKAVAVMPPAVPVTDNASGDFFRKLVKSITPIASTLFPASAPLINSVGNLADKGIVKLQERKQAKEEIKKANMYQLTPEEVIMLKQFRKKPK